MTIYCLNCTDFKRLDSAPPYCLLYILNLLEYIWLLCFILCQKRKLTYVLLQICRGREQHFQVIQILFGLCPMSPVTDLLCAWPDLSQVCVMDISPVPSSLLPPAVHTLKSVLHHHYFFIPTFLTQSHSWGRAEYKLYQKESGHLRTSPLLFLTICSICFLISLPLLFDGFWQSKTWLILVWAARQ